MRINRREFLGFALATAAARSFAAAYGKPELKLGVMSDIHVSLDPKSPKFENVKFFRKALEYFRDHGVDGVVIAGDLADRGRIDELELVAKTWFEVFPDDKAPDGRHVERLFTYGNHDLDPWGWHVRYSRKNNKEPDSAAYRPIFISHPDNIGPVWERVFGEPFARVKTKTVKGFTFVLSNWRGPTSADRAYAKVYGTKEFVAEHGAELPKDRIFFHVQHQHPSGTIFENWGWGHDGGELKKAYGKRPNLVCFSGHSHTSLTDERGVWQGEFTSVNAASISAMGRDYSGIDNAEKSGFDQDPVRKAHENSMLAIDRGPARQVLLCDVWSDHLVLKRRDIAFDEDVGPDWFLPMPSTDEWGFAKRKARRVAPAFAAGAKAVATKVDRCAQAAKKFRDTPGVEVAFPVAETREGCRVFDYAVRPFAKTADGEKPLDARFVLSTQWALPLARIDYSAKEMCYFPATDFPADTPVVFRIAPRDCFGLEGKSIEVTL